MRDHLPGASTFSEVFMGTVPADSGAWGEESRPVLAPGIRGAFFSKFKGQITETGTTYKGKPLSLTKGEGEEPLRTEGAVTSQHASWISKRPGRWGKLGPGSHVPPLAPKRANHVQ